MPDISTSSTTQSKGIHFQPVKVHAEGQSEGMLAFFGDALIAVLVKLDAMHGDLHGRWYAEAAFNSLELMEDNTFASLDEAADWMRTRLSSEA